MEIRPTHKCFDDSLDLLVELLKDDYTLDDKLRLVHGLCRTPAGELYAHAWLENSEERMCVFVILLDGQRNNVQMPFGEFYAYYRVVETTKYSYRQAYYLNNKHGNYGPWKAQYRALCKGPDEPRREW